MKAETIMSRMRPLLLILSSIAFLLMIVALVSGTTITASAAAQPNAPSNTNAVAMSDSKVNVSWQDNSPNETGFEVHRSTNGPSGAFTLIAIDAILLQGPRVQEGRRTYDLLQLLERWLRDNAAASGAEPSLQHASCRCVRHSERRFLAGQLAERDWLRGISLDKWTKRGIHPDSHDNRKCH